MKRTVIDDLVENFSLNKAKRQAWEIDQPISPEQPLNKEEIIMLLRSAIKIGDTAEALALVDELEAEFQRMTYQFKPQV